ncbi:MAG: hypothetical protein AVDCRST_MAG77-3374 [uncultured Chloroflexi bacterium]|uniref:Uncharacterized protein n=1 Tax=uncultured Chloroflexota bacterium TaxID=166587 RepID=A0A6J4JAH3_9CHLR|nr:MAG: hypothetical protein AVDCRST_MAG77-3374 [uncultured Chloroflexota bacterium]
MRAAWRETDRPTADGEGEPLVGESRFHVRRYCTLRLSYAPVWWRPW